MKLNKLGFLAALALGGLLTLGATARAQSTNNQDAGSGQPAGVAGRRQGGDPAQMMKKQLDLSDDQVTKLRPVLAEQRTKMAALRTDTTSNLSREDRIAKGKEIRNAADAKIKEILTPEQYTKWQKLRQNGMQGGPRPRPGGTNAPAAAGNAN